MQKIKTPKKYWKKIKPERFVYHLTFGGELSGMSEDALLYSRMNYALEGIWGKDNGSAGVWANNQMKDIDRLWPMPIDSWDFCFGNLGEWWHLKMYYCYDVWRIDTTLFDAEWYVDPVMTKSEAAAYGLFPDDYVYTENSVPPHALKVFTFDMRDYSYYCINGKGSSKSFYLNPVSEINEFIDYKRRLLSRAA